MFEIANTATGYATTPTTLVSFNGTDGQGPNGSLIADADGNLFGTTAAGGANGDGTVFEIANTASGYASTPTTLVSFNGSNGSTPLDSLLLDADGNLFGGTAGAGANGQGTVFEIANTATGYASTPTTLVNFDGSDGANPFGSLIIDANSNLFGTAHGGGANLDGTVFEIANTATGYASTPTTLVNFDGGDGANPFGSLIADAQGDLLGTTSSIPSFLSHDSNVLGLECRPVAARRRRSGQVDWITRGSDAARDEQQGASPRVTASQTAVIWRSK